MDSGIWKFERVVLLLLGSKQHRIELSLSFSFLFFSSFCDKRTRTIFSDFMFLILVLNGRCFFLNPLQDCTQEGRAAATRFDVPVPYGSVWCVYTYDTRSTRTLLNKNQSDPNLNTIKMSTHELSKEEIDDLRASFEMFDCNNSGKFKVYLMWPNEFHKIYVYVLEKES